LILAKTNPLKVELNKLGPCNLLCEGEEKKKQTIEEKAPIFVTKGPSFFL